MSFEYPVHFTTDAFEVDNKTVASAFRRIEPGRTHRFIAVVDDGVLAAWPGLQDKIAAYARAHGLHMAAPVIGVEGGERCKNDPGAPLRIHQRLADLAMDRQSFVLAVGGGAMLDMVGFAAATAHRGVRLIRMPTTVLGQNDSGIGVKNAVNLFGVKNYLGTFAPPFAVINDVRFIETLKVRDRVAGIAEAVKVGLVRDVSFFEWLTHNAQGLSRCERSPMSHMIRECARLHLQHIATSGDPFETGSARPLDFGHWAAHRLERLSEFELRHGEAVAMGMAIDTHISSQRGLLPTGDRDRVCELLEAVGLPLWHRTLQPLHDVGVANLLPGLDEFREHLGGELSVTLLVKLGEGVEVHAIHEREVKAAVAWLAQRRNAR